MRLAEQNPEVNVEQIAPQKNQVCWVAEMLWEIQFGNPLDVLGVIFGALSNESSGFSNLEMEKSIWAKTREKLGLQSETALPKSTQRFGVFFQAYKFQFGNQKIGFNVPWYALNNPKRAFSRTKSKIRIRPNQNSHCFL